LLSIYVFINRGGRKMQENQNAPQQQENLSEILRVRRAKLAELQSAGKDPFKITKEEISGKNGWSKKCIQTTG
jgi:hypothetical protein